MNEYLETQVMTASREQLHLMLIDSALRHCNAAKRSLEQDDREGTWSSLSEARAHVGEMLAGVSPEENETLDNMRALFKFVYRELMLADTEKSVERIESAMQILLMHRETWSLLIDSLVNANDKPNESQPKTSLSFGA